MAETLNNAFVTPLAATDTLLYTCPALTTAVLSNMTVCNTAGAATTFRIYIKHLGVTDNYLYNDQAINGNITFLRQGGDVLIATDELWVRATLATLDFSISLVENSP